MPNTDLKYREVVESASEIISITDRNGNFTFLNFEGIKKYGYALDELHQMNYLDMVHPEFRRKVQIYYMRQFLHRLETTHLEFPILTKTGATFWLSQNARLQINEGEITGFHLIARDVTEKKRTEQALVESEKKFRNLVENAYDGICIVQDKIIQYANRQLGEIVGCNNAALINHPFMEFIHPDKLSIVLGLYEQFITNFEDRSKFAIELRHHNGNKIHVECNISVTNFNNCPAFLVIVHDITERILAENALKESQENWQIIAENAPDYIISVDRYGNITSTNKGFSGIAIKQLIGSSILNLVQTAYQERVMDAIRSVFSYGNSISFDFQGLEESGSVWFTTRASAVKRKGEVISVILILSDINHRKRVEKALEDSKLFVERIARTSSNIITLYDLRIRKNVFQSRSILEMLNYDPTSIVNDGEIRHHDLIHTDDKPLLEQFHKDIVSLKDNETSEIKYRLKAANGSWRWLRRVSTVFLRNSYGIPVQVVSNFEDITKQKQVEEAISNSERRYRLVVESASEVIFSVDLGGNFLFSNTKGLEISGYSLDELKKLNYLDLIAPAHRKRVYKHYKKQLNDLTATSYIEYPFMSRDGRIIWFGQSTSPRLENGVAVCFDSIARDISERKHAEVQIKATLAEKDVLLKEIHHRVKNNLQVIYSMLNLQADYCQDNHTAHIIKECRNRVKSMVLIHEELYQSTNLSKIDFSKYVENLTSYLLHSYGALAGSVGLNIDVDNVEIDIDAAIPCGLIINELVANSLKHAFPDYEMLNNATESEYQIQVAMKERENRYNLMVSDNGIGFPPSLDFRNTDSLGLSIVTALTEQLDGTITLQTEQGTKFLITFKKS